MSEQEHSPETTSVYHSRRPIDAEELARLAGVRIHYKDLGKRAELSGLLCKLPETFKRRWAIGINSADPKPRRRFTIAHEVVHLVHRMAGGPAAGTVEYRQDDRQERACDRIAAELLMPADLVIQDVLSAGGRINTYTMARRFEVSLTAMRVRLRGLGLL